MAYFATEDNTRLYYQVEGSGQPIIFIHGWSCSHIHWAGVIKEMKSQYQCISYDHRGHNASECSDQGYTTTQLGRDLRALIEYLDLDNVILVGHSMGGHVIFSYVSQFGCDRLSKIAILDMSPKLVTDDSWKDGAFGNYTFDDFHDDMELLAQQPTDFMWKFWRLLLPDFAALPEAMKDLIAPGLKGTNHTLPLIALWQSMFTRDYRETVKDINVPTLYIIPEKPIYPMGAAEYVKVNVSAPAEVSYFEGCTHMSLTEKPVETANVLKVFFDK